MAQSGDISYTVAYVGTFTLAEVAIAIVCSCVPLFPRFFQEMGPKLNLIYSMANSGSIVSRITRKRANTSSNSNETGNLTLNIINNITDNKR